jgi:hypothetical protein
MSRAYRIRVRETLKSILRARDHVSTQMEVLEILPREQMADLLREELERRGFQRRGQNLVRQDRGITITVEPDTGTVTVQAETATEVDLQANREGHTYEEWGRMGRSQTEKVLREEALKDLQRQADRKTEQLQKEVTDRLEGRLRDLRVELDQVLNGVTAEALKRKAAQIGQIKELTEDRQNGTLTIVLEV